MNATQNGRDGLEEIFMKSKEMALPPDVEARLRGRLAVFETRLENRRESRLWAWLYGTEARLRRIPKPVYAAAALMFAVLALPALLSGAFDANIAGCESVAFMEASNGETVSAPWFWENRLRRGLWVTVPAGREAEIKLQDGSTIRCESNTLIALDWRGGREIRLGKGSILVVAKPDAERLMVVETGKGNVRVTGTEFRVTVTP